MLADLADILRLVAIPAFAYAAYHDHTSRRVPNQVWLVLVVVALVALVGELSGSIIHAVTTGGGPPEGYLATLGLSLLFIPIAYAGWAVGILGGADSKAVMALALVFPITPAYAIAGYTVPLETAPVPFVATVAVNALVASAAYLVILTIRNLLSGHIRPEMIYATPIDTSAVADRFGIVLPPADRTTWLDYLGVGGVDAEVLRAYRDWRGLDPGDDWMMAHSRRGGDRWRAGAFAGQAGRLYGTSALELRDTLDHLAKQERVWFSPALPYIVPLFVGLVLALTVGLVPLVIVA